MGYADEALLVLGEAVERVEGILERSILLYIQLHHGPARAFLYSTLGLQGREQVEDFTLWKPNLARNLL